MLLLKWRSYIIDMKLVNHSSLWYSNINKNLNKFSSTLEIYLKNNSLKNNVNIKLLSYFIYLYYNFKTQPIILYTKKNIITYKIRKDTPRGLCVYLKNCKLMKYIDFLNYQKNKVTIDNKLSKDRFSGSISNFFDFSKFKALIINDKMNLTQVKSHFRLKNCYSYYFSLNILFLKKFTIFSKESYLVLNQIKSWNNFIKFNKIILTKLILNKIFLNNLIINDTLETKIDQQDFNFYSYSNFRLLKKTSKMNLTFLKGKTKLKEIKTFSFTEMENINKNTQKISFLYFNKRIYRLFYFVKYYKSLKNSRFLLDFILLNFLKTYINYLDLIKFKI